jgi:hypothetical protein
MVVCWQRRYLCTRCGATTLVVPMGVLSRFVYTLGAILGALFAAAATPIGDGLDDRAAYERHGVDRLTEGVFGVRWSSLERWIGLAETWWPCRSLPSMPWRERASALLAGFLPGSGGRDGAIARGVLAHAAGGRTL